MFSIFKLFVLMFPGVKLVLRIHKASHTSAKLLKFDWDLFSSYDFMTFS